MKIRTFIRLLGLATIGGVAYVHTQRRGEWTVASLKDTLRHLQRSMRIMISGEDLGREPLEGAASGAETASRNSLSDERTPRSYSDYMRKNEPGQH